MSGLPQDRPEFPQGPATRRGRREAERRAETGQIPAGQGHDAGEGQDTGPGQDAGHTDHEAADIREPDSIRSPESVRAPAEAHVSVQDHDPAQVAHESAHEHEFAAGYGASGRDEPEQHFAGFLPGEPLDDELPAAEMHADDLHPDDLHPDDLHPGEAYPGYPGHDDARAHDEQHADVQHAHEQHAHRASKKVRRRRRNVVLFLVAVVFVVVAVFAFQAVRPLFAGPTATDYPGPGHGSVAFTIDPGSTGRTVATAMVQQGIVGSETAFLDALSAANGDSGIQPGTFQLKQEMKASDAVAAILSPDNNKVHYAAIAQNLRESDVLPLLAKSTGLPLADFQALAKDPAQFGLPAQAKTLEGYLAPGEYRFPIDMSAKDILAQLVKTTKDTLVKVGVTDPATQYRDLTIASILEFEGNEANYAQISGAIENRLNHPNAETGGRLESDATVAYGLGIKTYEITDAQKKDTTNPYNTFAKPGLPVGPIGSPKEKAITAAAHPASNPYYFWVTVNLDTGETLYATTYAEHLKNVAKYTAWCDANQGKCK